MVNSKITARYAKSLLELAEEQGTLGEVYQDICLLNDAVEASKDFRLLLRSPIINSDKKHNILELLFKGKISELTFKFFSIIIRKRRESVLPEIGGAFIEKYNRMKGILPTRVITASAIEEKTALKLKDILQKATKSKEIAMEASVDEDLIGGLVLQFEDNLYDASIASRLKGIKNKFKNDSFDKKI